MVGAQCPEWRGRPGSTDAEAGAAAAAPLPQRDDLPLAGMQVRPSGDRKIGRLLPSAILCVHFFCMPNNVAGHCQFRSRSAAWSHSCDLMLLCGILPMVRCLLRANHRSSFASGSRGLGRPLTAGAARTGW